MINTLNIHYGGRNTMTYFQYSDLQKNRVENWASVETSSLLNHKTIDPDAKVMPCGHIAGAHAWRVVDPQMELFEVSRKGRLKF